MRWEAPDEMTRNPTPEIRIAVAQKMGIPPGDLRWAVSLYIPESRDAWTYQAWVATLPSEGLAGLMLCSREAFAADEGAPRLRVADEVLARTGKPLLVWRISYYSAAAQA